MAIPAPTRTELARLLRTKTTISRSIRQTSRQFANTSSRYEQQRQQRKRNFSSRLRAALRSTKIKWYPIPVGVGVGFLGFFQFYKVQKRGSRHVEEDDESLDTNSDAPSTGRPRRRQRVKPEGPWSIQIMYTLPLKAMSRLWGRFNELTIPYYLRVPGFKLYAYIFGVNLSEVSEADLHKYPNLAAFFYRTLKPGVRPLDPDLNALLSPADGKIIQFGVIERGEVEQVKGVTYRLDALLGERPPEQYPSSNISSSSASTKPSTVRQRDTVDGEKLAEHEEFAQVNGISYTIPNLFSGASEGQEQKEPTDQSTQSKPSSESEVQADLLLSKSPGSGTPVRESWCTNLPRTEKNSALYYVVVYLAPGDYHRFHSPVSWVVSHRRHFAGELYSVSPYLQRTLPGLFTLNERVVLMGRWRHGFFSYTPVGATNVGSIIVNFDKELRTNSLNTDTAADRAAEEAQARGEPYSGFAEATYYGASKLLGGHPLQRGEEMGGFQLGSTIVLVFEAPKSTVQGEEGKDGGWKWNIAKGQKVKVGQSLGTIIDEKAVGSRKTGR